MKIDFKDPKNILLGAVSLAALGAGGSLIGLTIEPQSVTDLRVKNAALEVRVELLEEVAEDCAKLMKEARSRVAEED